MGLIKLLKRRYQLPFRDIIPTNSWWQLRHEGFYHKVREYGSLLRRELDLYLSQQKQLQRELIPETAKRILWLAPAIKNIGDAIMALSGRCLLVERGYVVDALVTKQVLPLFEADNYFTNVVAEVRHVNPRDYDLIILDCVKSISLKTKKKYFKNIPYLHFRGHFDGIEFNWTLFSFQRLNAVLNYPYALAQVEQRARPSLVTSAATKLNQLVIAIGGQDTNHRVYAKWQEVITGILTNYPQLKIILIGNHNGKEEAEALARNRVQHVDNQVDQLSLAATSQLISQSQYFIGCDGGLMHIAIAHDLVGVGLFGYFEPEYRLPYATKIVALYDSYSVANISPGYVVTTFARVSGMLLPNNSA